MSILLNQMNLVHKLELPIDMIRVIKSYAFKERTAYKAEIIKNKIIHCINHTYYSGANYLRSE